MADDYINNTDDGGKLLKEVAASVRDRLTPKYGEGEARAMCRIIFENLKGWSPVDMAIRANEPVSDFICGKVDEVVEKLLDDQPIQLIFGNADFYGMNFKVTTDTLIPRPETAELVDIIVKENQQKDLAVLDAGTGTGCIAIALARNLPFADVTAIDISEKALDVAKSNATALKTRVNFQRADMLALDKSPIAGESFDIIVSNPPYIAEKEKPEMPRNVLDFEPASALFVPDSDPLRFYSALLHAAIDGMLRAGGRIYFEINPLYASQLESLARDLGLQDISVIRDSFGKLRFMKAHL